MGETTGAGASEELTADEADALSRLSTHVANQLARGRSRGEVIAELTDTMGWPDSLATKFVDRVSVAAIDSGASDEGRQALADRYARHMIYGALWALGGILVTWWTYSAAASSPGGGRYVVAYGAILYGVVDFVRGLVGWSRHKG